MQPRYTASDDGKTVDGKIVVYMAGPQSNALLVRSAKADLAKATVQMLASAAEDGTPFCEECEEARRKLSEMMEQGR